MFWAKTRGAYFLSWSTDIGDSTNTTKARLKALLIALLVIGT